MKDMPFSTQIGGRIPYFFYDLMARIAPGAFLVAGALCLMKGKFLLESISGFFEGKSPNITALQFTVGLFLFGSISTLVGFLIASPAYLIVERVLWRWKPFSIQGLADYMGAQNVSLLQALFEEQFGYSLLPDSKSLNRASFQCSYHVWKVNPYLGAMTARFDAELLAAQSLVLASLGLTLGFLKMNWFKGASLLTDALFLVLVTVFVCSCMTFSYHRRKRVYGRFGLFLSLHQAQEERNPSFE